RQGTGTLLPLANGLPALHVPCPELLLVADRDESFAVRAEGNAINGGVVPPEIRETFFSVGPIPHAQRAAGGRGLDHRLAVVGQGERAPVPEATSTSKTDLAFLNIPDLDSALFSPRQQRLAVGRENQSLHQPLPPFKSAQQFTARYVRQDDGIAASRG